MSDKPKAVAVSVGKENPIKRLWGFVTKKKNNNSKDVNPEKKPNRILGKPVRFWLILLLMVFMITGLTVVSRHKNQLPPANSKTTQTNTKETIREILQADNSDGSKANVVNKFGRDYDSATKNIRGSDPTNWDKAKLDQAYLSLVYADKIGAFTQVYTMMSYIEFAQKSGLNIDDNSYGVNQSMRDSIRERADINSKKVSDKKAGVSGE